MKASLSIRTAALIAALLVTCAAHAELVVIVHPKNVAATISQPKVADYYLGTSKGLKLFDLPLESVDRAEFYRKVADKNQSQVRAIWSRLIFTGRAIPPKEVDSSAAAVKAVASDERAIGYVQRGAVDSSVKVVLSVH